MKKKILLLTLSLALLCGTGMTCRHDLAPSGVYGSGAIVGVQPTAPPDVQAAAKSDARILYEADKLIVDGYRDVHAFVLWEYQHRAELRQFPVIKQAADKIRGNAEQWFTALVNARVAFARVPVDSERSKLQSAMNVIESAIVDARGFMKLNVQTPSIPMSTPPVMLNKFGQP